MTLNADEARARCEAATPGLWTTEPPQKITEGPAKGFSDRTLIAATAPGKSNRVYTLHQGGTYPSNDLRFIAHARADLPAALDDRKRFLELLRDCAWHLQDFHEAKCESQFVKNMGSSEKLPCTCGLDSLLERIKEATDE